MLFLSSDSGLRNYRAMLIIVLKNICKISGGASMLLCCFGGHLTFFDASLFITKLQISWSSSKSIKKWECCHIEMRSLFWDSNVTNNIKMNFIGEKNILNSNIKLTRCFKFQLLHSCFKTLARIFTKPMAIPKLCILTRLYLYKNKNRTHMYF